MARAERAPAAYVSASFAASDLGNWASQIVTWISKLSSGAILWFGAHAVMRGEMTVGELCASNRLSQRVTGPMLRLAKMWQDFQQTRISIARVGDIMNAPSETATQASQSALPAIRGEIRFDRVLCGPCGALAHEHADGGRAGGAGAGNECDGGDQNGGTTGNLVSAVTDCEISAGEFEGEIKIRHYSSDKAAREHKC